MESTSIHINNPSEFRREALAWANQFPTFAFYDSNGYGDRLQHYDWVLAVDSLKTLVLTNTSGAFDLLEDFRQRYSDSWLFGFLSYDLKNDVEPLTSQHPNRLHSPELLFFQPRFLFRMSGNKLTVNRNFLEATALVNVINAYELPKEPFSKKIELFSNMNKDAYLERVRHIQNLIRHGEVYEVNLCRESASYEVRINPLTTFLRINDELRSPFSAYVKHEGLHILSFSPERYLRRQGDEIISQPIKGTAPVGNTPEENEAIRESLASNPKERAENVMIVDLVRNDLAKTSLPGTVRVENLFEVQSFQTINQMVSTIRGKIDNNFSSIDVIRNSFPMGSMTGAPKFRAMQVIDEVEMSRRGVFSGTIGYFSPDGNFDFNVVIRSVLYQEKERYLSFTSGGAITYDSVPEDEFQETLLKGERICDLLYQYR